MVDNNRRVRLSCQKIKWLAFIIWKAFSIQMKIIIDASELLKGITRNGPWISVQFNFVKLMIG